MNIIRTALFHRSAALLVLAMCSTVAVAAEIRAPETGTTASKPAAIQPTDGSAAPDATCDSGDCTQAAAESGNAMIANGVQGMPKLDLPSLLGTETAGEGC